MEELLDTLPEVQPSSEFIEAKPSIRNQPNFTKKSGQKVVFKQEHTNFNKILANQQFRASPFATLKQTIQNNMQEL